MMIMSKVSYYIVAIIIIMQSCSNIPDGVMQSIKMSGDNAVELRKVINHYKEVDIDQEKLSAIYFLIDNMKWHYSLSKDVEQNYYSKLIKTLSHDSFPEKQRLDLLWQNSVAGNSSVELDLRTIKSDYLIKIVDRAFEQWQGDFWSNHLSFEEFCETLLPYKLIDLQCCDYWKDSLNVKYKIYNEDPDTKPHGEFEYSVFHVAKQLNAQILEKVKTRADDRANVRKFLADNVITKIPYGDCEAFAFAHVAAYISKGIGAYIEYIPCWGDRDGGHAFYSIITKSGITVPVMFGVVTHGGFETMQGMNCPKVFRRVYSVNEKYLKYQQRYSDIYDFSSHLFYSDVTNLYNHTADIQISIKKDLCFASVAYICVYNGGAWRVVDFGSIDGGNACFENLGKGILYIVKGVDKDGNLIPVSNPFVLGANGEIEELIPDMNSVEDVILRRKYLKSDHVWQMEQMVVGGEIHASNFSDFKDYDVVYKVNDVNYPDMIKLDIGKSYRYWRYYSAPEARCNIAEFQLFDSQMNQCYGSPIINFAPLDSNYRAENLFDNDWLTSYESDVKSDSWIGCDLGQPKEITHVRVVQRSDDNGIHPGDEYVLMYWDNGVWNELYRKVADDKKIEFGNVPRNTLLLLKNMTRGTQERVFTIENGNQRFW